MERIGRGRKPGVAGTKEAAAAVIPSAEFGVTDAEEVLVGIIEFEADGIVVVVEDAAAVHFEEAVVGHLLFEVEAFDAAEGAAGQAGALLKGAFVTIDQRAADTQLDPVPVIFRDRFGLGVFGEERMA